jgi:hypothetical protein
MRDVLGRLNVIDDGIRSLQNSNQSSSEFAEKLAWTQTPGNSVVYSYYAGVAAGNPSGNTNNIETAEYSDKVGVVFTQTFTYDANDNVLSIIVS